MEGWVDSFWRGLESATGWLTDLFRTGADGTGAGGCAPGLRGTADANPAPGCVGVAPLLLSSKSRRVSCKKRGLKGPLQFVQERRSNKRDWFVGLPLVLVDLVGPPSPHIHPRAHKNEDL